MPDNEEVGSNDGEQHDKNLHEGDEKTSNHIKLRECMLGCGSDVSNGVVGPAKGVPIHDRSDVAVLGKILTHQFVAVAEGSIAALRSFFAGVHEGVEPVRVIGED